jgi:hypothetical protein
VVPACARARRDQLAFRLSGKVTERTLDVGDTSASGKQWRGRRRIERSTRNAAQAELLARKRPWSSRAHEKAKWPNWVRRECYPNDYESPCAKKRNVESQVESGAGRLNVARTNLDSQN